MADEKAFFLSGRGPYLGGERLSRVGGLCFSLVILLLFPPLGYWALDSLLRRGGRPMGICFHHGIGGTCGKSRRDVDDLSDRQGASAYPGQL